MPLDQLGVEPYFDWYQATFDASEDDLLDVCLSVASGDGEAVFGECRGVPQYDRSLGVWPSDHARGLGEAPQSVISYGGNNGAGAHVRVTGRPADALATALRRAFPGHRVARLDSCFDFTGEGVFDRCSEHMEALFLDRGVRRDRMGFPENGQTYYLGAPKAPMRVRCYEKGKQLKLMLPPYCHWVRLECQYRPRTAEKAKYSSVSPSQLWGATRWTRDLITSILALSIEPIRQLPPMDRSLDQKLFWVLTQYQATFSAAGHDRVLHCLRILDVEGEEGLRSFLGLSERS